MSMISAGIPAKKILLISTCCNRCGIGYVRSCISLSVSVCGTRSMWNAARSCSQHHMYVIRWSYDCQEGPEIVSFMDTPDVPLCTLERSVTNIVHRLGSMLLQHHNTYVVIDSLCEKMRDKGVPRELCKRTRGLLRVLVLFPSWTNPEKCGWHGKWRRATLHPYRAWATRNAQGDEMRIIHWIVHQMLLNTQPPLSTACSRGNNAQGLAWVINPYHIYKMTIVWNISTVDTLTSSSHLDGVPEDVDKMVHCHWSDSLFHRPASAVHINCRVLESRAVTLNVHVHRMATASLSFTTCNQSARISQNTLPYEVFDGLSPSVPQSTEQAMLSIDVAVSYAWNDKKSWYALMQNPFADTYLNIIKRITWNAIKTAHTQTYASFQQSKRSAIISTRWAHQPIFHTHTQRMLW